MAAGLYPNLLPAREGNPNSLTVDNAAAGSHTLKVGADLVADWYGARRGVLRLRVQDVLPDRQAPTRHGVGRDCRRLRRRPQGRIGPRYTEADRLSLPREGRRHDRGVGRCCLGLRPRAQPSREQTPPFPCELHSRRSRQECRSCAEAGVAAEAGARSRVGRRAGAQVESAGPRRRQHRDHGQGGGVPMGYEHLPGAVDLDPLLRRRSCKVGRSESPAKKHLPTADASRRGHDCPVIVRCRRRSTRLLQRKSPANLDFSRAAEGIRTLDLLHGKQ